MKKLLCFGDSNVFGFVPDKGTRYGVDVRWSGILKMKLKDHFDVIEAGMNGRTCFSNCGVSDDLVGVKNIQKYLKMSPDVIILAIGINDLQFQYKMDEEKFYIGLKSFVEIVRKTCTKAKVILLAPSELNEYLLMSFFSCLFDEDSIKLSKYLARIYEKIANELSCEFVDLNKIAQVSLKDGLHYEPESHKIIADFLLNYLE